MKLVDENGRGFEGPLGLRHHVGLRLVDAAFDVAANPEARAAIGEVTRNAAGAAKSDLDRVRSFAREHRLAILGGGVAALLLGLAAFTKEVR